MASAGAVAADRVRASYTEVKTAADPPGQLSPAINICVFDVISSGATLEAFQHAASSWAAPVARKAFAALATKAAVLSGPQMTVQPVLTVEQETVPATTCTRCREGLPFTDPSRPDPQLQIAADSMWWMLRNVTWGPETYGPKHGRRYPLIPHLSEVFERWGDWIAYKYAIVMEGLGLADAPVVVCPEESAALALVERLSARFDDQLVAILLPRELLVDLEDDPERARAVAAEAKAAQHAPHEWARQLIALSGGGVPVIVIDEFNATGTTARAIADLVRAFQIQVAAYLPFLDWDVEDRLTFMPLRPLYGFPNPRPPA
jgi:hypothetical protein